MEISNLETTMGDKFFHWEKLEHTQIRNVNTATWYLV